MLMRALYQKTALSPDKPVVGWVIDQGQIKDTNAVKKGRDIFFSGVLLHEEFIPEESCVIKDGKLHLTNPDPIQDTAVIPPSDVLIGQRKKAGLLAQLNRRILDEYDTSRQVSLHFLNIMGSQKAREVLMWVSGVLEKGGKILDKMKDAPYAELQSFDDTDLFNDTPPKVSVIDELKTLGPALTDRILRTRSINCDGDATEISLKNLHPLSVQLTSMKNSHTDTSYAIDNQVYASKVGIPSAFNMVDELGNISGASILHSESRTIPNDVGLLVMQFNEPTIVDSLSLQSSTNTEFTVLVGDSTFNTNFLSPLKIEKSCTRIEISWAPGLADSIGPVNCITSVPQFVPDTYIEQKLTVDGRAEVTVDFGLCEGQIRWRDSGGTYEILSDGSLQDSAEWGSSYQPGSIVTFETDKIGALEVRLPSSLSTLELVVTIRYLVDKYEVTQVQGWSYDPSTEILSLDSPLTGTLVISGN